MTGARPTAYVDARLVDPASGLDTVGGLLVSDGRIVDLGPGIGRDGLPEGTEVVDGAGHVLCPGLVDPRVRLSGPQDDGLAARAAAAGGVTALLCLPEAGAPPDTPEGIATFIGRWRQSNVTKAVPYGAVTVGGRGDRVAELDRMAAAGAAAVTDLPRPVARADVLRDALAHAAKLALLLVQHPEDPDLARDGVVAEGETAARLGLGGVPAAAEAIAVARDLRLLELTGGRLHIAHLSTTEAIDLVRRAKARGQDVSCDATPAHFALNHLAVGGYDTAAKLSPPLRGEADRLAVIDGLRDGTIDMIASDHTPVTMADKLRPFDDAPWGGAGLETLLPVSLELVRNGHLDLIDLLGRLTRRPAERFGLDAGRLAAGRPADFILVDPQAPWRIDPARLTVAEWSTPFAGHLTQGRVLLTVVDGRPVHRL